MNKMTASRHNRFITILNFYSSCTNDTNHISLGHLFNACRPFLCFNVGFGTESNCKFFASLRELLHLSLAEEKRMFMKTPED